MAERTEFKIDAIEDTIYHDMENNKLSMLLRVDQTGGRVLDTGSFTERAIPQLVQRTTGAHPTSPHPLRTERSPARFRKVCHCCRCSISAT